MRKTSILEYQGYLFYEEALIASNNNMKVHDLVNILEDKNHRHLYYESYSNRIMKYITLNGHLLPKVFFRTPLIIEKDYMPIGMIFRRPKILVYNKSSAEGVLLKHRKIKFFALIKRTMLMSVKLFFKRKSLLKAYRREYSYMTSREFWEKQFFSN